MLAGFTDPAPAASSIDGADMTGVPPHERPVNMMFQSYALFPHMTVEKNVGYGLRRLDARRRSERKRRVEEALEMVQLGRARPAASRTSSPAARSSAWRWPAR